MLVWRQCKNRISPPQRSIFHHFPINTHQSLRATRCGGRHKKGKLWLVGGNSNNGANCGLACANSNNAWTNSNANYSARITSKKKYPSGHVYCVIGTCPTLPSLGGWCISIASDKPEQYEYLRRQRPASCPLC